MREIHPVVYKPGTDKIRIGRGFSIGELKEAGLSISEAKKLGLYIDRRRKSIHKENIDILKDFLKKVKKGS